MGRPTMFQRSRRLHMGVPLVIMAILVPFQALGAPCAGPDGSYCSDSSNQAEYGNTERTSQCRNSDGTPCSGTEDNGTLVVDPPTEVPIKTTQPHQIEGNGCQGADGGLCTEQENDNVAAQYDDHTPPLETSETPVLGNVCQGADGGLCTEQENDNVAVQYDDHPPLKAPETPTEMVPKSLPTSMHSVHKRSSKTTKDDNAEDDDTSEPVPIDKGDKQPRPGKGEKENTSEDEGEAFVGDGTFVVVPQVNASDSQSNKSSSHGFRTFGFTELKEDVDDDEFNCNDCDEDEGNSVQEEEVTANDAVEEMNDEKRRKGYRSRSKLNVGNKRHRRLQNDGATHEGQKDGLVEEESIVQLDHLHADIGKKSMEEKDSEEMTGDGEGERKDVRGDNLERMDDSKLLKVLAKAGSKAFEGKDPSSDKKSHVRNKREDNGHRQPQKSPGGPPICSIIPCLRPTHFPDAADDERCRSRCEDSPPIINIITRSGLDWVVTRSKAVHPLRDGDTLRQSRPPFRPSSKMGWTQISPAAQFRTESGATVINIVTESRIGDVMSSDFVKQYGENPHFNVLINVESPAASRGGKQEMLVPVTVAPEDWIMMDEGYQEETNNRLQDKMEHVENTVRLLKKIHLVADITEYQTMAPVIINQIDSLLTRLLELKKAAKYAEIAEHLAEDASPSEKGPSQSPADSALPYSSLQASLSELLGQDEPPTNEGHLQKVGPTHPDRAKPGQDKVQHDTGLFGPGGFSGKSKLGRQSGRLPPNRMRTIADILRRRRQHTKEQAEKARSLKPRLWSMLTSRFPSISKDSRPPQTQHDLDVPIIDSVPLLFSRSNGTHGQPPSFTTSKAASAMMPDVDQAGDTSGAVEHENGHKQNDTPRDPDVGLNLPFSGLGSPGLSLSRPGGIANPELKTTEHKGDDQSGDQADERRPAEHEEDAIEVKVSHAIKDADSLSFNETRTDDQEDGADIAVDEFRNGGILESGEKLQDWQQNIEDTQDTHEVTEEDIDKTGSSLMENDEEITAKDFEVPSIEQEEEEQEEEELENIDVTEETYDEEEIATLIQGDDSELGVDDEMEGYEDDELEEEEGSVVRSEESGKENEDEATTELLSQEMQNDRESGDVEEHEAGEIESEEEREMDDGVKMTTEEPEKMEEAERDVTEEEIYEDVMDEDNEEEGDATTSDSEEENDTQGLEDIREEAKDQYATFNDYMAETGDEEEEEEEMGDEWEEEILEEIMEGHDEVENGENYEDEKETWGDLFHGESGDEQDEDRMKPSKIITHLLPGHSKGASEGALEVHHSKATSIPDGSREEERMREEADDEKEKEKAEPEHGEEEVELEKGDKTPVSQMEKEVATSLAQHKETGNIEIAPVSGHARRSHYEEHMDRTEGKVKWGPTN